MWPSESVETGPPGPANLVPYEVYEWEKFLDEAPQLSFERKRTKQRQHSESYKDRSKRRQPIWLNDCLSLTIEMHSHV